MQTANLPVQEPSVGVHLSAATAAPAASAYAGYQIIRRNGAGVSSEPSKIAVA